MRSALAPSNGKGYLLVRPCGPPKQTDDPQPPKAIIDQLSQATSDSEGIVPHFYLVMN